MLFYIHEQNFNYPEKCTKPKYRNKNGNGKAKTVKNLSNMAKRSTAS